ncbi:MAG: hypothetical protein RJB38_478 [Pseudomonadota bacterium]|jgi:hypothetical protein
MFPKRLLLRRALLPIALALMALAITRIHGQYCLPIFSGAGADAMAKLDPYLLREGRPDFFKYGPIWAFLLTPIASLHAGLPRPVLEALWCFINLACFFISIQILSDLAAMAFSCSEASRAHLSQARRFALLAILTPLALSNAFYGQINSVLLALLVLFFRGSTAQARTHEAFWGGFSLGLAIWMKVFPIIFLAFVFLPLFDFKILRKRLLLLGLFSATILGLIIPVLIWKASTPAIFEAWLQVLSRDLSHPHLKVGLASILSTLVGNFRPNWLAFAQLLFFGGILTRVALSVGIFRHQSSSDTLQAQLIQQTLLLAGSLLLSHMTEPPTMALLAPAALVLVWLGHSLDTWILLGGITLLPSDLVPSSIKEAIGGQYLIKSLILAYVVTRLLVLEFRPRAQLRRPS